ADSVGEAWHRWARAEHAARRAALAGRDWTVDVTSGRFAVGDVPFGDLLEALEAIGDLSDAAVPGLVEPSDRPYARGGLAFSRAVRAALRNGLTSLRGDAVRGFGAHYADGVVDGGPTLLNALDRRAI